MFGQVVMISVTVTVTIHVEKPNKAGPPLAYHTKKISLSLAKDDNKKSILDVFLYLKMQKDGVVSFLQRRGWEFKLTMKHSIKYMYAEALVSVSFVANF